MKRRHPKQSIQETSHEINNNNNDNKSNEIINNLINALTQTAIHRTEKEDVLIFYFF